MTGRRADGPSSRQPKINVPSISIVQLSAHEMWCETYMYTYKCGMEKLKVRLSWKSINSHSSIIFFRFCWSSCIPKARFFVMLFTEQLPLPVSVGARWQRNAKCSYIFLSPPFFLFLLLGYILFSPSFSNEFPHRRGTLNFSFGCLLFARARTHWRSLSLFFAHKLRDGQTDGCMDRLNDRSKWTRANERKRER